MNRGFLLTVLFFSLSAPLTLRANGDRIRGKAPVTALIMDLKAGNLKPLERAYFNQEIDFFLDYQGVPSTVAKDLFYLREAGRALENGEVGRARNSLQQVRYYGRQKEYLRGVIEAAEGRLEAAYKTFQNLIADRKEIDSDLLELAYMGAARVSHEAGDYGKAIYFYNRLHQLDKRFFQSVFEKAWSFYLDGDMNGALGAALSFTTPYAENRLYPEAYIVRAAAFYHMCLFDRANETVEEMRNFFVPIQTQVKALLNRKPDTWLFEDKVLRTVNKRLIGFMVQDGGFRRLQRAYLRLKNEPARLSGADRQISEQALNFVKARLSQEAVRVLQKADRELTRALEQADSIQIEILQLGVNVLVGAPIEMRDDLRLIKLGDVDFDPQIQFWPLDGEFWLDELGSYYYGLRSVCDLE